VSDGRGTDQLAGLAGRLLRADYGTSRASRLARLAHEADQAWEADPADRRSLDTASSLFEQALAALPARHPQRFGLVLDVAGCHRKLWLVAGDPERLRRSSELLHELAAGAGGRSPRQRADLWLSILQNHVLRFGDGDQAEARRARECLGTLGSLLAGAAPQPWTASVRTAVLLAAAQLAAFEDDEQTCSRLLNEARQAFGGPLVLHRDDRTDTWIRCVDLRSKYLQERYETHYSDPDCRQALRLLTCWARACEGGPDNPVRPIARRGVLRVTRYRLLGRLEDAHGARADLAAALEMGVTGRARCDYQWYLGTLLVLIAQRHQLDRQSRAWACRLAQESLAGTPSEPGSADHALHVFLVADVHHQFGGNRDAASLREILGLYRQALQGLTGTGNEWLVRQRLSLVHRALQEVEPYEDHLTPAVQQLERALQVCPEPQAGQETPALHSAMGDLLRLRHERNGDAEDYRRARVHTERGVLLARDPGMAPGWAVRVSNHALVLAAKRRREDVHAAEQLLREALGSDHVHPDDEAVLRHNLGTVLREAGAAMQDGAQLREAEQALRHAVRLTSVATAVGRLARRNLALALYSRWELDRKTS